MELLQQPKVTMRPPKLTVITKEGYEREYWPNIHKTLKNIFSHPFEITLSQEEVFRHVYNICCQRHTSTLYNDLVNLINEHLKNWFIGLNSTNDDIFIQIIAKFLMEFKQITEILCSLFRYLEKIYIVEKLHTNLKSLLLNWVNTTVVDTPEMKERLDRLLKSIPSGSDPGMLMNLVKNLYELKKEFSMFNPMLFSMYIPCLHPSRGLEYDLKETYFIIQELLPSQGFTKTERNLKRKYALVETM